MTSISCQHIVATIITVSLLLLHTAASCRVCSCLQTVSMDYLCTVIERQIEARLFLRLDECAIDVDNCDQNADCTDTVGSFICMCKHGYQGDGITCSDIDECARHTDNCDVNAVCTNTDGSFTCSCRPGYQGDGTSCDDVDECSGDTDNCDDNADCTNTDGSFTCSCRPGYQGDGTSCDDVNECTTGAADCVSEANCENTIGSFTCTCPQGRDDTNGREEEGCYAISSAPGPACGGGDWFTVISLDLQDSQQTCPTGWSERTNPVRTCEISSEPRRGCTIGFQVTVDRPFTRVAGRATGYQVNSPDAFFPAIRNNIDINDAYVDGLSVTYSASSSSTRNHIWTFAAALREAIFRPANRARSCPCLSDNDLSSPSFVQQNYFCESGNPTDDIRQGFYPEPLWDGLNCEEECCSGSFSTVPWFCVTMDNEVENGAVIEVRLCKDQPMRDENIAIENLQIYIQ